MKHKLLTLACLLTGFTASAQLVNQGGTITIQQGATLIVESDVVNNTSGTITNNGIMEIEGKFENTSGTLTSGSTSELKFTGAGNSDITAGTHTIHKLTIAKDNAGTVTVLDDVTVNDDLIFQEDNNQVVIGSGGHVTILKTSLLENGGATMGADDNNFFATTGDKTVRASVGATALTFPVGPSTTKYTPITITENGTVDLKGARVSTGAYEDGPAATTAFTSGVVNNTYIVEEETAGGSNMDVTVQWDVADQLMDFDPAESGIARYEGNEYLVPESALGAATANPSTRTRTGLTPGSYIVGGDKVLEYVALSPKAILGGAYNGTDMRDDLRSLASFPTADPYPAAPYNYTHSGRGASSPDITPAQLGDLGANSIVDWVFLELRDDTDNTNILDTKSVFVQKDGDIVEADGTPVKFRGADAGDYFIAVKHRNHLGIMSMNTVALSSTPTAIDFSDGSAATFGTNAQQDVSGTDVMWGGDVNGDGQVKDNASPSDKTEVANAVLAHPSNTGVFGSGPTPIFGGFNAAYSQFDNNLDGNVYDNVAPSDATFIANLVLSHPANTGIFGSGPTPIFGGLLAQLP